ncbi:hypothetical protein CTAM01_01335 [Colletotrichum tamarilloi]|uniref:Nephrocystin 3-like N-terminal domain-containing protein n=1 Tax=Colletotrichum tamarilloi TaxID=1209934 RepID=A0ABQ9RRJ3_9PEZI|nr:uncharacterized protein CTAM01_01335 [Colletotrichum tamarilloi]KAK1510762.1 hypothetical protein CTAM01_01335 [Colletotrichum tamarilloi]
MSVKLRHPRTGMWLERHSSFQQWLRTQGSRLWLSGIPGAGKTVLAGSIIGHALARSSDTVAVGFFFCDYKNETTQSPVNILGGLAYQLAIQSEKAYSMLEEYYFELHPDKGLPRSPNTEDLGRTILRMCQVFEHTYIVVDGLDECGDHAEEVVEALCDIAENSDELSMALLSRDEDNIQRHLRDSEKKFLNIQIAAHTDDITEFLTSEIERRIRSRKLVFEDHSLKAEILESLVAGAHGIPLHYAAISSVDCLHFVLEEVASISLEATAENGYTVVHFAVLGGETSAIELVHARGANINARSVDGQLALHLAVDGGNLAAVEKLLELGSEMTSDYHGMTPLLLAYQREDQRIINCLRDHDKGQCDVVPDGIRSAALAQTVFKAIQVGNLSSCQQLLAPLSTVDIDLPGHTSGVCTALGVAVCFGRLEIITWLLEQGANADYPYGNDGSIIQLMMSQPRLNTGLQAMLKRYTATGGSVLNEPGCLVATAVRANNEGGLRILLDHLKANRKLYAKEAGVGSSAALALAVNRRWQGRTPLHWAASMKNVSTVQLLIDSGADLEATDDKGWTPLLVSIKAPATFDLSAVVRALLESGSDLKYRDNNGVTPIAEACTQGNPRVISALMDRGPDVLVEDYGKCNVLHRLFTRDETDETNVARPALFIKLTRMGVNPHKLDIFGCSALHLSIFHKSMVALLLNGDLQIQDERPIPWSTMFLGRDATNEAAACLTTAFRMYRRKLSTEKLRTLLNLEAGGFWNPLSFAASRGQIQVMKNILSLGIPIDFEGCPEGSALMAASSAGNLESVIYLVRHGASISFQGHNDFRSAVELAATSPRVLRWLLVDRFTDQKKLDQFCHESTSLSIGYKPWSGTQKAEMIISGRWERQPHESSRQYWARLSSMTEELRGKFLPPNKGKTTRRQSKLVPIESVNIVIGGYFVPYDASLGERVTRKSKWSELSLEVRECLERYCL